MERRNFIGSVGGCCICAGIGAVIPETSISQTIPENQEIKHSCDEKMDFAEKWLEKFMNVLDSNLDEKTRKLIMEENGKACAISYLKSIGQYNVPTIPYADFIKRAARSTDGTYQVDGNILYMTYMNNYQGKVASENICLCPFVESKPENLSHTYCHCSVGYIKETYSRRFGQPVKVELLTSVLRGDKRCKFKIELA
jgi:hypothetical protein